MKESLKVGLEHVHTYSVPENKTVPYLYPEAKAFQEMPRVFATGYMVGLMEWRASRRWRRTWSRGRERRDARQRDPHRGDPAGMTVTVRVRCIGVEGAGRCGTSRRKTTSRSSAGDPRGVRRRLRQVQRPRGEEGRGERRRRHGSPLSAGRGESPRPAGGFFLPGKPPRGSPILVYRSAISR